MKRVKTGNITDEIKSSLRRNLIGLHWKSSAGNRRYSTTSATSLRYSEMKINDINMPITVK